MEFSSFNPHASPRNDIGHVVSSRASTQAIPDVHDGSLDDGTGEDHGQSTARLQRQVVIVNVDNRVISYPSSHLKCVIGPSGAVLWMNPMSSVSDARRRAAFKGTSLPMAGDPYLGQNLASPRTHGDYDAFLCSPNSAIGCVDIEHSGELFKNDWPSETKVANTAPSTFQANPSLPHDWKATIPHSLVAPLGIESSSRNRMLPKFTAQAYSTDQFPTIEHHYGQYGNNPFSDANLPRYQGVPSICVDQASDNALTHATTFSHLAVSSSAGPQGPDFASSRPDLVTQDSLPGNPCQAIPGSQHEGSPMCHDKVHLQPYSGTTSLQEAPTPKGSTVSDADCHYKEPGMPRASRHSHHDNLRREPTSKGRRNRSLRASHEATKPGKSKGRRKGPLNAAQKEHAKIVRNAGPRNCDCGQRKVKCTHVVVESPHSPGAQGASTFLAVTNAQRETAIYGEPDTPSSQNTSWQTETTPVSPFSPSRNQSFGNAADLDLSRMDLLTADYQGFNDIDDAEGDLDDEEMLQM